MVRAWAVVAAVLTVVVGACAPQPAASAPANVRRPVVVIHGWQFFCGSEDADTWRTWIDEGRSRGYAAGEISVFSYDTCRPSAEITADFGRFVDDVLARTGAEKVNVLAHSMGSIEARWCIRFGTCAGKVDKFMSVAGANHGTVWANVCELAFWSSSTCDLKPDGAFLTQLNEGDETWGDVRYVSIISWCDLTIVPFLGAMLDGADVNVVTNRCLSHTDWRTDRQGARFMFDWFDTGRIPPTSAVSLPVP